ncbi:amidase signature domain-containing protein [Dactylonectria macrodidyma]|uniref:Amidase signature domain-containing protein n=1 Tax=Dactylonectria macrodidyma TaxID=307937 RepID=A0A9P9IRU5_9HYPO|nr:amidase signature domain-containing protein [Dactylonectria macrodidyma]
MISSPYKLTAAQVLELFKADVITVESFACSLLDRIHKRDSIPTSDPSFVLSQARGLDNIPKNQRGPLHGLAIGVKDVMNTKDMPTQYGSLIYQGHGPSSDASAVAILRAAGALIFGKTTTTGFTLTNAGPKTTNPHDPNRTPGGSSCGSAAATGGSIVRPASFTAVFAMKPTFNAISPEGCKSIAPTFDTFGFFARSIEDLQLLAGIFGLLDDGAPYNIPLEEVSVTLMKTPMWSLAGPGTISAMSEAVKILRDNGINAGDVCFPPELANADSLMRIQKAITYGEVQASFLREYRLGKANLATEIREIVENTSNCTRSEWIEDFDRYAGMRHIMNKLATNYTVILTPSAVDEAPIGLHDMGSASFNTIGFLANLDQGFHMPVINVPEFVGTHGMPVGLSFVGPRFCDQQLLKTCKALSEVLVLGGGSKVRK